MYQALYRKWRPRDFDSVVGQDHITKTLKNEVASQRFSHAYLFTGSRGTGKTSCSKILAKAVNCPNLKDGNPCNTCDICKGIDNGSILDVVEIDAASNNGVDNIRDLREEAYFTPAVTKYRIYILDECHMLSAGAVNALLKILEEPPEHVVFILATTEIHKVLPTILSRCQRFDFKRIKPRVIADRLLYVAEQENLSLAPDAALLIARLSDGGMRDALSLLDLCISHGTQITVQTVTQAAGLCGNEHLFTLTDALLQRNPSEALRILNELSENSLDFTHFCEQLVGHYRNLMLLKTIKAPDDLVQAAPEDLEKMGSQVAGVSLPEILDAIDLLQGTLNRLPYTTFKRTELEMALIRLCEVKPAQDNAGLAGRVETVERRILALEEGAVPRVPAQSAVQPKHTPTSGADNSVSKKAEPPQGGAKAAETAEVNPFDDWPKVLAELKKLNGALYGAMIESHAYSKGDMMLIDCANEMFRSLLRTSVAAKESLRDAILSVTGKKYNLGPYNPERHSAAPQKKDPLDGMLKKASALNVPVELN